jgi:hypothetical protein
MLIAGKAPTDRLELLRPAATFSTGSVVFGTALKKKLALRGRSSRRSGIFSRNAL